LAGRPAVRSGEKPRPSWRSCALCRAGPTLSRRRRRVCQRAIPEQKCRRRRPENGAATYDEFKRLIGKGDPGDVVGCTVLCETFYWPEEKWLPVPPGWQKNIQRYKNFDTADEASAEYWELVAQRLVPQTSLDLASTEDRGAARTALRVVRLGQGAFRTGIIDAYGRRCTVTGERTLPALEAAHIVPFSEVQRHELRNGLLLRADLHKLFDDGYVTVDTKYRFHVSRRIKDEYENGRDYYALHGREIRLPEDRSVAPDISYLEAHATRIYRD
jgi:putative restriction endonuclease